MRRDHDRHNPRTAAVPTPYLRCQTAKGPIRSAAGRLTMQKDTWNVLANRLTKRGVTGNDQGLQRREASARCGALRRYDFDVAVLDLQNGRHGRHRSPQGPQNHGRPTWQVIMLTGHGSETAARQGIGMSQGACDYLTKPCELDELLAKIREAFCPQTVQARPPPARRGEPPYRPQTVFEVVHGQYPF